MTPKEVSEKLRVVAVKHWGLIIDDDGLCISRMATDAADTIDSLQAFVDHITSLPSCNSCDILASGCIGRPAIGESVRYNCPWYSGPDRVGESAVAVANLKNQLKQRVNLIFGAPKTLLD